MNNKNLAIIALIVVVAAGLWMYLSKETPVEAQTAAVEQPVTEQAPVAETVTQETAAVQPPVEVLKEETAPVKTEAPAESLGASSSGLGH